MRPDWPGRELSPRQDAGLHGLPPQIHPIFHLSFKGELGIALESLQGKIDLI